MLGYKDVSEIEGWLGAAVLPVLESMSKTQEDAGVFGNIMEVGVHHGKFFIFLASLLKLNEFAYALDIFENQEENKSGSGRGDLQIFSSNISSKLSSKSKIAIIKDNSININSISAHNGMKFRLISIDGGHSFEEASHDLMLAKNICHPNGVVIVDDYQSEGWDGVYEATNRFLLDGSFKPIALGCNKIFLLPSDSKINFFLNGLAEVDYFDVVSNITANKSRFVTERFPTVTLF
jgi:hypothetical protein